MKKSILPLLCTLFFVSVFASPALAQQAQTQTQEKKQEQKKETPPTTKAEIKFKADDHDFGKIGERDKKVSYKYEFTNAGKSPLVVTRVMTSCKCVDASYSKKPVPPGGSGSITVTYNPRKQSGVFYKAIQVYANTADQRHVIVARGEVVP